MAATLPPAPEASKATATQRYAINVGLFALESNARNAHTKLLDAGLSAFTQELDTSDGKRTRVRVGRFDSRAEADAAVEKIRPLGLDALVFRH